MTPDENHAPVCTFLEWDSSFFDLRIARLNRSRLDRVTLDQSLQFCTVHRIDCLYFLADSDDPKTPPLAEANGFRLTDVRVTLERSPVASNAADTAISAGVRLAREDDLGTLRAIARTAHRDTRFYFDQHFDRATCDRLYETWIENSFRGFAQAVLVADANEKLAAYLSCQLKADESQIGLAAVAEQEQGKGLGTKLVQHFLAWSREQGARKATVVTQGRNLAAQRLYQRNGFVTKSMQLWYHRWFDGRPGVR